MANIGALGFGAVGVFERTLPPRSKINYDPGYELALEVRRWFHYRHEISVAVREERVRDSAHLEEVMLEGYRLLTKKWSRYWQFLEPQAREYIREFKEMFRDVLAEMELTRQGE